jgi:hypothetical protein
MKRIAMLLVILVMSSVLYGEAKKGDNAKCLGTCKNSCQKLYTTCVKDAKTDDKKAACKKSLDLCNSNCINKACAQN